MWGDHLTLPPRSRKCLRPARTGIPDLLVPEMVGGTFRKNLPRGEIHADSPCGVSGAVVAAVLQRQHPAVLGEARDERGPAGFGIVEGAGAACISTSGVASGAPDTSQRSASLTCTKGIGHSCHMAVGRAPGFPRQGSAPVASTPTSSNPIETGHDLS